MKARKYSYKVTDIAALEAAYPRAVETEKKPVRSFITKLLDCGVPVPGIALIEDEVAAQNVAASESTIEPEQKRTLGDVITAKNKPLTGEQFLAAG